MTISTLHDPSKLVRADPLRVCLFLSFANPEVYERVRKAFAHDAPDAYVKGERHLPDEMPDRRYYRPVPRGLEIKIAEALARLRAPEDKE